MKTKETMPRILVGQVIGDKMDKTVIVLVERKVKHPLYKKYIRRSTKLHVHDERNICREGDIVGIVQNRPISKTKAWRLREVIVKAR
uniref:Small ribosomal subunit protein uS17 n=2 Tax=Candidatus Kentrum sp. FM TaxID=2126340 RepID=A0A450RXE0_9GAMM|nr:MAG: small subunit ribosomal protein S17 [Candidatus Kentron sp. FM]